MSVCERVCTMGGTKGWLERSSNEGRSKAEKGLRFSRHTAQKDSKPIKGPQNSKHQHPQNPFKRPLYSSLPSRLSLISSHLSFIPQIFHFPTHLCTTHHTTHSNCHSLVQQHHPLPAQCFDCNRTLLIHPISSISFHCTPFHSRSLTLQRLLHLLYLAADQVVHVNANLGGVRLI